MAESPSDHCRHLCCRTDYPGMSIEKDPVNSREIKPPQHGKIDRIVDRYPKSTRVRHHVKHQLTTVLETRLPRCARQASAEERTEILSVLVLPVTFTE